MVVSRPVCLWSVWGVFWRMRNWIPPQCCGDPSMPEVRTWRTSTQTNTQAHEEIKMTHIFLASIKSPVNRTWCSLPSWRGRSVGGEWPVHMGDRRNTESYPVRVRVCEETLLQSRILISLTSLLPSSFLPSSFSPLLLPSSSFPPSSSLLLPTPHQSKPADQAWPSGCSCGSRGCRQIFSYSGPPRRDGQAVGKCVTQSEY